MKIQATVAALLAAVKFIAGGVPKRGGLPILEHLLVEASATDVRLTGGDLVHQASTRMTDAQVVTSGSCTVRADTILQLLSALPQEREVTLHTERAGAIVLMCCGTSSFRMVGLEASEYPRLQVQGELTGAFGVPSQALLDAIGPVRDAMAHGDIRYYLNALCIDLNQIGSAKLTATDGHRLHRFATTVTGRPDDIGQVGKLLLADSSIAWLARLLQIGGEAQVRVHADALLEIAIGPTTFVCKLIRGEYPPVEGMLSQSTAPAIEVNRASLLGALQRLRALLADQRVHSIRLSYESGDLCVSARCETDEGEEHVEAAGGDQSYALDVTLPYLMDAIEACPGETVGLAPTECNGPIHIRPMSASSYHAVVAPLRSQAH